MIKCGTERGRKKKMPPGHDSSGLPPIYLQCSERSPRRVSGDKYPGITHTHTHWPGFLVREREMEGVWFGGSVILLTH